MPIVPAFVLLGILGRVRNTSSVFRLLVSSEGVVAGLTG